MKIKASIMAAVLAGTAAIAPSAGADEIADFYKGKQITIIIGTAPGGGYGMVSQVAQRHVMKHVPGKPTLVLQFMPGGGGQKAHDYLYNVASRDGYTIGMPSDGVALAQRLSKVKYDAREFNALARFEKSPDVFVVMSRSGVTTIEQARKKELAIAATAKSSVSYMNAVLAKEILGFPMRIVLGYRGGAPARLAMERGEVDGYVWVWPTLAATVPEWFTNGTATVLAQVGLQRLPELSNVPTMQELATAPEDKALLEFMASKVEIGRHHSTPPGFPKAQLAALREAYKKTMTDPEFLAEAKKRKMALAPLGGEALQEVVNKAINAPDAVVDRMKTVIGYK
jgi:tripartite-type tricarboxylate transporter receptor subunit TctC